MHKFLDIIVLKEYYTAASLKRIDDIIANYNKVDELITMLKIEARKNNTYIMIKECDDTIFIIV